MATQRLLEAEASALPKALPHQLDAHNDEIIRLVKTNNWGPTKVQTYFVNEYKLFATPNMWKKRFKKLGLNLSNVRREVMEDAAREYQICLETGAPFRYEIPGHKPIGNDELWRYARRRGMTIVNGRFVRVSKPCRTNVRQTQRELRASVDASHPSNVSAEGCSDIHDAYLVATEDSMDLDPLEPSSEILLNDAKLNLMPQDQTREQSNEGVREQHFLTTQNPMEPYSDTSSWTQFAGSDNTLSKAHLFLSPYGFSMYPQICAPRIHWLHEKFLLGLDLSVATAFDTGQAKYGTLGLRGRGSRKFGRQAKLMKNLFIEAVKSARQTQMHKARKKLDAGLSYLCYLLTYCLPLALGSLFEASFDICQMGGNESIKLISLYAQKWCSAAQFPQHIEAIFASVCQVDGKDIEQISIQGLWTIYQQSKRNGGEFHPDVALLYGRVLNYEHKRQRGQISQEQRHLELQKRLAKMENMEGLHPRTKLISIYDVASSSYSLGRYQQTTSIAREGLLYLDTLESSSIYLDVFSSLNYLIGCCFSREGDTRMGLQYCEAWIRAKIKRGTAGDTAFRRMAKQCMLMHIELGNHVDAAYYKRLRTRSSIELERSMEDMDERFRNVLALDDHTLQQPENGTAADGLNDRQAKMTSGSASSNDPSLNAAWRPGVTNAERDMVLTSPYDSS